MSLFRKREKALPETQVRLARRIADRILRLQHKIADYLNLRTAGIPPRRWRIILLIFCLLFGGYSLHLILEAIY